MRLQIDIERKDLTKVIDSLAFCKRFDKRASADLERIIIELIQQRARQIHSIECKNTTNK